MRVSNVVSVSGGGSGEGAGYICSAWDMIIGST